jgi:hypothetical protein
MIQHKTSDTGSVAPGSGQHIEELIRIFVEILVSYVNPLFTDPLGQPCTNPPFTRYFDAYYSYNLPPGSTTTQYFGMNPSYFGFPKGLGNFYFSTTPIFDIVGAYSLPKTSVTQVTPTQPLVHTYPFTHGSGNIHASLFQHMHTPSALLGHTIGHMASRKVIHTTMVT